MFRFTIRDVLWLMVVVGVTAGWITNRQLWSKHLRIEREERNTQILKLRETRDQALTKARRLQEQMKAAGMTVD